MSTFEQKQIERYLPELPQLSHDARLELIARLSESLERGNDEPPQEKPFSFSTFCGAWDSDETAEELLESIRSTRTPNREVEWWLTCSTPPWLSLYSGVPGWLQTA